MGSPNYKMEDDNKTSPLSPDTNKNCVGGAGLVTCIMSITFIMYESTRSLVKVLDLFLNI